MAYVRALVSIPRDTTDPADIVTNTFHFDSNSGTAAQVAAEVHAELTAFYQALDVYMPSTLLDTIATVDYYDLEDAEPRVPVLTSTIALTCGTGEAYPPQVCLCLSFHGATGSGINMRRRRGRVYIGPLLASAGAAVGGRVKPTSAVKNAWVAAGNALMAITGTYDTHWAVFSPTTYAETGNLDDAFEDVVGGWVDEEFDIQRRRAATSQGRTLFP